MIGFVVDDPETWLSKSQKEKVKAWFRDNYREDHNDYKEVLDRIHYREPTHKYKGVTVEHNTENNICRVLLTTKGNNDVEAPVSTENLRERLRAKLRQKSTTRASVQTMGEDWKMYQKLLQSPAVKMIPAERLDLVLPNPDGVRKQRIEYEQFQKVCPDPTLKEYFELCLQN
jgi:hypothetical protein